jgi:1,2-dihydroxy-3-keto-5-methylthiopentene dioxygenase
MSWLTIYRDDTPDTPELRTDAAETIAARLAAIDVTFERWESPVAVAPGDDPQVILDAYRPYLDRLMGTSGAGSADVISLSPDHPQVAPMRAKFLSEHRHTEPEIRFFVHGDGHFVLHSDGLVYDVHCMQGDLIGVPAGIRHWFDAGERPDFTVLRVFTDTSGWVPHYTGDSISERFPSA